MPTNTTTKTAGGLPNLSKKELLAHVDHTLLKPDATESEIKTLCQEALAARVASVCVPPCYVGLAAGYLQNKIPVGTVIGFPNGYQTSAVKAYETAIAVADGAAEIDMVINIGMVKEKNLKKYELIEQEIRLIRENCIGKILKVIIETCYLTEQEKINLCPVVAAAGADYIKTSTGFGPAGATLADIALFRQSCPPGLKIKAAGGIRDFATAEQFVLAGCQRLGSSNLVKLCKE